MDVRVCLNPVYVHGQSSNLPICIKLLDTHALDLRWFCSYHLISLFMLNRFKTWAIKTFPTSTLAWVIFNPLPSLFASVLSSIYTNSLNSYSLILLLHLSSVWLESVTFSKPLFLIMCHRNFNCLFMILNISFLFSLKLPRFSHVMHVLSRAFVDRTTFLLIPVFHSTVRKLSRIHGQFKRLDITYQFNIVA